ncbi:MAG: acyl-CoA dehydrogenase family protein [Myxococcota bacterium]
MDFDLPAEDDPRRLAVREWLRAHPQPSGPELAEVGYVVPHWPRPWGLEADAEHQLIIDDELRRARVRRPQNPVAIKNCGPVLLTAGTEAQKHRYLMPALAGEEIWCQLFSEPGAGSDLANLSTLALPEGDGYRVTGQKIWSSGAQRAQFGILLARTDPEARKRAGLSYFIVPMKAPAVDIRPIRDMTGQADFSEVFFDGLRLPAENRIGAEGQGWQLARATLQIERVAVSEPGALWGTGPTARDLVEGIRGRSEGAGPVLRQRAASLLIEGEILRLLQYRNITARLRGQQPGPESSVYKVLSEVHGQQVLRLANDLLGPSGILHERSPFEDGRNWWHGFWFSPALTIGVGTTEILKNVIAERVLGLPRDPEPDSEQSWSSTRGARAGG